VSNNVIYLFFFRIWKRQFNQGTIDAVKRKEGRNQQEKCMVREEEQKKNKVRESRDICGFLSIQVHKKVREKKKRKTGE
jgi:hypothetical protein